MHGVTVTQSQLSIGGIKNAKKTHKASGLPDGGADDTDKHQKDILFCSPTIENKASYKKHKILPGAIRNDKISRQKCRKKRKYEDN